MTYGLSKYNLGVDRRNHGGDHFLCLPDRKSGNRYLVLQRCFRLPYA